MFLDAFVERRLNGGSIAYREAMAQTLSANELKRFRSLLEARISELERATRKRDDIAVETSPDQMDDIQRAAKRDLAIHNIDRESRELRNARAALRRMDHGAFGVCEECEEDISPKRLGAMGVTLYRVSGCV